MLSGLPRPRTVPCGWKRPQQRRTSFAPSPVDLSHNYCESETAVQMFVQKAIKGLPLIACHDVPATTATPMTAAAFTQRLG